MSLEITSVQQQVPNLYITGGNFTVVGGNQINTSTSRRLPLNLALMFVSRPTAIHNYNYPTSSGRMQILALLVVLYSFIRALMQLSLEQVRMLNSRRDPAATDLVRHNGMSLDIT
jgi:hypothetical protein